MKRLTEEQNPFAVVVEVAPSNGEYTTTHHHSAVLVRDHIRYNLAQSDALSPIVQAVNVAHKSRVPVAENRAKEHISLIARQLSLKTDVWTGMERLYLDGVAYGLLMAHQVLDGASAADAMTDIIERMNRAVDPDAPRGNAA